MSDAASDHDKYRVWRHVFSPNLWNWVEMNVHDKYLQWEFSVKDGVVAAKRDRGFAVGSLRLIRDERKTDVGAASLVNGGSQMFGLDDVDRQKTAIHVQSQL